MSNYNGVINISDKSSNWTMAFNHVRDGSEVLDIGCSKGGFGEALIRYKNCKVDGIELDRDDARLAAKVLRTVVNDSAESALEADLKNKKYDHVVLLDVIEHFYRPSDILKQIRPHLKKNGTIIFSIPNMSHTSVRIMLLGGDFIYSQTGLLDNTHLHFYTEEEINKVFREANYQIDVLGGAVVKYGDDLVRQSLKNIGVKSASDDLIKILLSNNGEIYQFVGSASYKGGGPKVERVFSSPNPKAILSAYNQSIDDLAHKNEQLKEKNLILNNHISDIENSKAWRLVKVLRRVLHPRSK